MRFPVFAVALVALAASACARAHLDPSFGVASRDAFLAQRARAPDEPAPRPKMALDAQETSVIAGSYVQSLAGKSGKAEPEPVLFVTKPQGGAPQQLPPSVPRE